MFLKHFTMACAAASLMVIPATRAQSDNLGAFVGGAIVGGVVGHAIGKNQRKQKRVVRKTYRSSGVSSAVRAERREIQTSLNYFGFPAGTPDGVLGRNSRAAISSYQAHLGYPATGQLTQYEKDFLLTSYRRALAGGALTTQQIAANPQGPRGLLNQYRNEAAGVTTATAVQPTAPAATTTVVVAAPQAVQPQVLAPQAPAATTVAAAPAPALPNFMATAEPVSLASHCNQIGLLTTTNGGFTKAEAITDVNFAMNEQFCLARTYAISIGEQKAAAVTGATPQQIEAQCQSFTPLLKPFVASLANKTQTEVVQDVSSFITSSGMPAAQMATTAKICLSVGYRTDNMDMAAGSALLMVAGGEPVYGELIGHHMAQGFGVGKDQAKAMPWFEVSLGAVEAGTPAVFAPGQPERTALLRKATANLNGAPGQATVQPAAALPSFNVSE